MSIIKVQRKGQVTLPTALRQQIGIVDGDFLEVRVHRGSFVLSPTVFIDRSKFPTADGEYTPEQRRVIDARLTRARKGSYHGPFDTAEELINDMKTHLKWRAATKKTKPRRSR